MRKVTITKVDNPGRRQSLWRFVDDAGIELHGVWGMSGKTADELDRIKRGELYETTLDFEDGSSERVTATMVFSKQES